MKRGRTISVAILLLASSVQFTSDLLAEDIHNETAFGDLTIGFGNDTQVALLSQIDHLAKQEAWGLAFEIGELTRFSGREPAALGGKIPVFTRGQLSLTLECDKTVLQGSSGSWRVASEAELCSGPGDLQEQNYSITIALSTHSPLAYDIYDDAIYRTSLVCHKTDTFEAYCYGVERGFQIDILFFGVEERFPDEFVEKLNDFSHRLIVTARERFIEATADPEQGAQIELTGRRQHYTIPVDELVELKRETIDGIFLVGLKKKPEHASEFGILVLDPAKHHQGPGEFSEILTSAFDGAAMGISLNDFEMKQTLQDLKLTQYEKLVRLDPEFDMVFVEVLFVPAPGSTIENPVKCVYKLGSPDAYDDACAAWLELDDAIFYVKFPHSELSNVAGILTETRKEGSLIRCAPAEGRPHPSSDAGMEDPTCAD